LLLASCFFVSFVDPLFAGAPTYWKDIYPVFRKHCLVCHKARYLQEPDVSGGLALDSYAAVRKGSTRPVLQPGKSADSLLIKLTSTANVKERMPLGAEPLTPQQIDLLRRWIDAGAPEGTKPADAPDVVAKKTGARRKLDVTLPTSAVPPPGVFGGTSGKLALSLKVGPLAPVAAVAFSPDGKLLASCSYGQVVLWDLTAARPVKLLTNVLGAVNDVRFSPDGTLLAVAGGQPSARGDLRLYRVADWKLLGVLRGHEDVVFSVAFRPDGKKLASASFDKTVRLWDVAGQKLDRVFTGHSDFVYAVAFSPDGKRLASASKDRTVTVVEADSGKGLLTLSGMEQDVMALAYRPDGKALVSSGFEPALHWWDAATGERTGQKGAHSVAVHELAFSPDGKLLVSAGAEGIARVWDGTTGAHLQALPSGSPVYAVAISPDKKLVASGSFDGLVRLWDPKIGRYLLTLLAVPGRDKEMDWLALTPEGFASGSSGFLALGKWRMGGQEVASARAWEALGQPQTVLRAVRGEILPAPAFKK
jgi:WD40 repeat protein